MSKYSVVHEGKVLDYKFKKMNEFTYSFWVGDIYLGQVFNMDTSWTAVTRPATGFGPVNGFKTRVDACQFIIQVWKAKDESSN